MKKTEVDGSTLEFSLGGSAGDIPAPATPSPDLPKVPQSGSAPEFDQEFLDFMITLVFYLSGRQGFLVRDFEDGIKDWGMFLHNFKAQARRLSPGTRKWLDKLIGGFQTLEAGRPESLKLRSHAARLMELPHTVPVPGGYMSLARPGFPEGVENLLVKHPILQQVAREELRGVPDLVFRI
ncbi:hypothetical protein EPO17_03605 [Patescibacteria group bacterium]|nr:MAG: hypothetical protein EPO17_03605 [Patescibacteria group bacterium]